ncbi:cytochrome b [Lysobacter soli]|uniref:cytochrome b n=1 Tax=Lysobacter soli TaxID=453783 RepID=UPI00240F0063|nr:cytochrome b/b6 domain-containing protein [Lysobacter soli]MDG2518371.1 cytochrome b/b6 domain-containing protein [Lysobacter soli]
MNATLQYRYPRALRWIHWLSVALLAAAYISADSAEGHSWAGMNWHVLAGLGVLLMVVPRLMARLWAHEAPRLQSSLIERVFARTVHLALLLFMVVQPLIGLLITWAEGDPLIVPLLGWEIPPLLIVGDRGGEALEELHEVIGNVFYGVIGLHVLAALWHQFVRRDDILRRML